MVGSGVGLCVALLLVSVHGRQPVARIKFQMAEYIFQEGETSPCLTIVNDSPPSSRAFSVSYVYDSVLLGLDTLRTLTAVLRFNAGNSSEQLCIPGLLSGRNNGIACEPDIVGTVRLVNKTLIATTEPATATVRIRDNDSLVATFQKPSYVFSESSREQQLLLMFTNRAIATPITFRVSEASNISQQSFVVTSLLPVNTELNISGRLHSTHQIQLYIRDDIVGLENVESRTIVVSAVSQNCHNVQLGSTQVLIEDDDSVTVGLAAQRILAVESEGMVEICVHISAEIARPLSFTITTVDRTATSGEDYISINITGQFQPLSSNRQLCFPISILRDAIIEKNEIFSAHLTVNSPMEGSLQVVNTTTVITILDSSNCTKIVLEPARSHAEPRYVLRHTSVCITCDHKLTPNETSNHLETRNVTWQLMGRDIAPTDGDVLQNGTLIIYNSSHVFQTQSATVLKCATTEYTTTNAIKLGSVPKVLNITSSTQTTEQGLKLDLTCRFSGIPPPNVTWLFQDAPLMWQTSVKTNDSISVLTLSDTTALHQGNYTCRILNKFGSDNATVATRPSDPNPTDGGTGGVHSSATTNRKSIEILCLLILIAILV